MALVYCISSYTLPSAYEKVSEYDQEIPQSYTADQSKHLEEESQNIYSYKTVRQ